MCMRVCVGRKLVVAGYNYVSSEKEGAFVFQVTTSLR